MAQKVEPISRVLVDIKGDFGRKTKISHGGFGVVYRATRKAKGKKSEMECAIKIMNNQSLLPGDYHIFDKEVKLLFRLKHPAIIELVGWSIPVMNYGYLALVTKYMPNGSLSQVIQKESDSLAPEGWDIIKKYCCIVGIAVGMCYVHQQDMYIIHRDLKPDNILLDENFYPKICDFGISKMIENQRDQVFNMTMGIGTALYMAPEQMSGDTYDKKVDVYAYAYILYELFVLKKSWSDQFPNAEINPLRVSILVQNGQRPEIAENIVTNKFRDLIKRCWSQNPDARPSFKEIVLDFKERADEFFPECSNDSDFMEYMESVLVGLNLE
ncbi:hypothetical protein TRFO_26886 [Tritrichomonas foetus]|uniref:Protein kinase domain-containing protein n=1 Tax=Tritrichomonas foetus TaxID=1144522 RepID=A0A1J4K2H9_9EUKA|nr:hypothetical protein TRFO_26886 [Tritrichomonas foetus]|eukprot:OHT05403.1 hypothetical protein TRFO_26886 [Tritrichomonas foetus]